MSTIAPVNPALRRSDSAGDGQSVAPGPRFLLYSHDGVGLGHVRRNLNLATALTAARPDSSVLIATSAEDLDAIVARGVDVLRLPGIRKLGNERYAARRLPVEGVELCELRAGVLAAAVQHFRPHVMLADKHPGGVHGELVPAIEQVLLSGGRAALGLRDVVDCDEQARHEWREGGELRQSLDLHDLILVYGQEDLLDPVAACGLPATVRRRTKYCGYVLPPHLEDRAGAPAQANRRSRPMVLAMAGGGEDGAPVLRAFLAAAASADWDAQVVTGPHASPEDRAELEVLAAASGACLEPIVRDLGALLRDVDAMVCMGGYNSLAEVLATAVPAVCVPRVAPRTEQLVRARAFAGCGLIRMVTPSELTPERLRREVEAALATDRRALARRIRRTVDLDGASRAAAALLDLADDAAVGPDLRREAGR